MGMHCKPVGILVLVGAIGIVCLTGCASPRPIPRTYFQAEEPEISVTVTRINEKPAFRDSGGGGLLGTLISESLRGNTFRESMEGLSGNMVGDLIKQALEAALEEHFFIEDASKQLHVDIEITQWGWFLPTTLLGIKAGSYKMEIVGKATTWDVAERRKKVGFAKITTQIALGSDPETANVQEVLREATKLFGAQVANILLKDAPED